MDKEIVLNNINKIHTTELGVIRIKKNLGLDNVDVISYIRDIINSNDSRVVKKGKNFYCSYRDIVITINSYNYSVITLHKCQDYLQK